MVLLSLAVTEEASFKH